MELEIVMIILILINICCTMSMMRTLKKINKSLEHIEKSIDEIKKLIKDLDNDFKEHVKQCKC